MKKLSVKNVKQTFRDVKVNRLPLLQSWKYSKKERDSLSEVQIFIMENALGEKFFVLKTKTNVTVLH